MTSMKPKANTHIQHLVWQHTWQGGRATSRPFAMLLSWPPATLCQLPQPPVLGPTFGARILSSVLPSLSSLSLVEAFFLFTPSTHRWRFGQQTRTACRSRWTVDVKNDGPHYNWDVFFLFFVSSTIILSIDRDRIVCFCSTCARVGEAFSLLVAERSIWQMKSNVTSPLEEF